MISVLLGGTGRLVADIIRHPAGGAGPVWVCVRSGQRAAGKGWLGCWSSSGETAPEEAEVGEFLSALSRRLADPVPTGSGLALPEHHFHEGWQAWGPGIPGPLVTIAEEQSPADETPGHIRDPHLGTDGR
ncbi:hypothetical protein [Streptomyces huasconensis]|uniref:hypothetical protein n=1 Tax=Streptomyces huasconensis TaxID=1854574 RepID=UPI0034083065